MTKVLHEGPRRGVVFALVVMLSAAVGGCGGSGGGDSGGGESAEGGAGSSDKVPPAVVLKAPLPGQTGVTPETRIVVTFDEALLPSSIDAGSLTLSLGGKAVAGTLVYDEGAHSITFIPALPLGHEGSYAVALGGKTTDLAGNPVAAENWSFTTEGAYQLGATPQETIDQCMSESDKDMLTLVNKARAAARYCGNSYFEAAAALAWNCQLQRAARAHSDDMASHDFFSHTGRDGSGPGERISAAGYPWRTYGENIAGGAPTAEGAMAMWMSSAGHCANVMRSGVTEMGAAMSSNPASTYRNYWTQVFAAQ